MYESVALGSTRRDGLSWTPMTKLNGQCLCGEVKVKAQTKDTAMAACHCNMCRRWSSGPLLAVECGDAVQWSGDAQIGVYASSQWAERGFCKQCGTCLFYRIKSNQHYHVPVGLFDEEAQFELGLEIFVDEQPPGYRFANPTTKMTGAEVFEMFGPG